MTQNVKLVGGVSEGTDAWIVSDILASLTHEGRAADAMYVVRDDRRLEAALEVLAFAVPHADLFKFPAWDCLPYDRVSPRADIQAQRVAELTRWLASRKGANENKPRLFVTTVNALLQRVPPQSFFEASGVQIAVDAELDFDDLVRRLSDLGYRRVGTVRESGEFAPRGGLIDIFPVGHPHPVRVDLFGDSVESLKTFDPLSQRTLDDAEALSLGTTREFLINQQTQEKFRAGFRKLLTDADKDPYYQAVSEGRVIDGLDHWQPLFFDALEALPALVAPSALIFEPQTPEALDGRFETIQDFYAARLETANLPKGTELPYKPLPPEMHYLDSDALNEVTQSLPTWQLSGFTTPDNPPLPILDRGIRPQPDFADTRNDPDRSLPMAVAERVKEAQDEDPNIKVLFTANSFGALQRVQRLWRDASGAAEPVSVESMHVLGALDGGAIVSAELPLNRGFQLGTQLLVLTAEDIFGQRAIRPRRRKKAEDFLREVSTLKAGDLVVHIDHGIGRYQGLISIDINGAAHDVLEVEYHGGDKLFVPVENIEVLSRFGEDNDGVLLDRLGGVSWQARKAKAKDRITVVAIELMRIAAARKLRTADKLIVGEPVLEDFAQTFPFVETDDQLTAIEDVIDDLGAGRPMDRLVCGDVGFGKTEVAIRAAFVAVAGGKQASVVVPTTLLARQHFKSFSERLSQVGIECRQFSRLVPAKQLEQNKKDLAEGRVDVAVGTHSLLSESIEFKDLGLLVIDEEQRFGVKQKERLKKIRETIHVLTLTATPIPRTLQLALTGVKDLSLISTPPVDRLAVRTFILPWDGVVLRDGLMREHFRGGQSFVVCPRLRDLTEMQERLKTVAPELKVTVAHGQMAPQLLEDTMNAFYDKQYDILLSTNIIESGIDIPSVNTIIIHRADMFGLSALYQLRGRVGRSKQRGYAYLTVDPRKPMTADATRRLEVMKTLDSLGAGFNLASHDMDIRGAGNLVGEEQSGHIREVGVELYQQMLEEAVTSLSSEIAAEEKEEWSPILNTGLAVLLPEDYVSEIDVRLNLYRRLGGLESRRDIDSFGQELEDRFGRMPLPVENLLFTLSMKLLARRANVEKLDVGPKGVVLKFKDDRFAEPMKLLGWVEKNKKIITRRDDQRLVYKRKLETDDEKRVGVERLLKNLVKLAQGDASAKKAGT